jgi:MFS family permease
MKKRATKAVMVLCLVQFVDVLGVTELITAMPRILSSLPAPQSAASLLLTAYAMCFGGLLLLGARLGDRIGHRRTLLIGIAAFFAGSLIAAAAPSLAPLIVGRCAQGAAAALSVPAALRLLIAATPSPTARRRALAAWSVAGAAAGAIGYLIGGGLTQLAGWRAMFWINLPIAALIAAGVVRHTASGRRPALGGGIDVSGALLFTAAAMCLVLAGSELQRPRDLVLGLLILIAAVGLAASLRWVERRAADPLLPAQALRQPHLQIGAAAAFLNTATTSSAIAIATLQLQRSEHLSPAAAGLRLVPFSICVIAGAGAAAPALRLLGARSVIGVGLATIAAGDALLMARSPWLLAVAVAIAGAGIGLSSVAATALGTDVGEPLQAVAGGVLNTAAQLGTALGVAALLLLASATAGASFPLYGARLGYAAAAALAIGGAGLTAKARFADEPTRSLGSRRARAAPQRGGS